MTKTLVVVESPAKAKTIERYLGDGYAVRAFDRARPGPPRSKLGVDPTRTSPSSTRSPRTRSATWPT